MPPNPNDRAAVPVPPPLMFLGLLAAGCILEFLFPSRPRSRPWVPFVVAGAALLFAAGLLAAGSFALLTKNKTAFDPAKQTTVIVKNGPFRLSRNPMYLALLLLLGAAAAIACSWWLAAALVVLFFVLDFLAVRPEEQYLARKFGDDHPTGVQG